VTEAQFRTRANPANIRPALRLGDAVTVPSMKIRILDGTSGQPVPSQDVTVNCGWRFLDSPLSRTRLGSMARNLRPIVM